MLRNVKDTEEERRVSESLEGVSENIVRIRVHPVGTSSTTISHRSELYNEINEFKKFGRMEGRD